MASCIQPNGTTIFTVLPTSLLQAKPTAIFRTSATINGVNLPARWQRDLSIRGRSRPIFPGAGAGSQAPDFLPLHSSTSFKITTRSETAPSESGCRFWLIQIFSAFSRPFLCCHRIFPCFLWAKSGVRPGRFTSSPILADHSQTLSGKGGGKSLANLRVLQTANANGPSSGPQ